MPPKKMSVQSGSADRQSMICRIASGLRRVAAVARCALPFSGLFLFHHGEILICRPAARPHSGGDTELRQQPDLQKNPYGNSNNQNPDGIHTHPFFPFLYQGSSLSAIIS
jgi:hypothetical protein